MGWTGGNGTIPVLEPCVGVMYGYLFIEMENLAAVGGILVYSVIHAWVERGWEER